MTSFVVPAWAVETADAFSEYAPASWVAAGFLGLLIYSIGYALVGWGRVQRVRAKYDRDMYERTGFVDPMAATFENKRIFLQDFVLPSDPFIQGKTFINCEIIGPANLFFRGVYHVHEQKLPYFDAVVLNGGRNFFNGITVENCTFRACSFRRITLMMAPEEYERHRHLEWLNWISRPEESEPELPLEEPIQPVSLLPPAQP